MPEAQKLAELLQQWERATDDATRRKAWDDILAVTAEQVFTIGTVNAVRQPVVVGKKLKNIPEKGYWAWDPGGYIGLYKPDTFWMTDCTSSLGPRHAVARSQQKTKVRHAMFC